MYLVCSRLYIYFFSHPWVSLCLSMLVRLSVRLTDLIMAVGNSSVGEQARHTPLELQYFRLLSASAHTLCVCKVSVVPYRQTTSWNFREYSGMFPADRQSLHPVSLQPLRSSEPPRPRPCHIPVNPK